MFNFFMGLAGGLLLGWYYRKNYQAEKDRKAFELKHEKFLKDEKSHDF